MWAILFWDLSISQRRGLTVSTPSTTTSTIKPPSIILSLSTIPSNIHNENSATIGRFEEIRQIARITHNESELALPLVIDALWWLALEHQGSSPAILSESIDQLNMKQRTNFLSAAANLGLIPLIFDLLAEGAEPTCHDHLLPPAVEVAAR